MPSRGEVAFVHNCGLTGRELDGVAAGRRGRGAVYAVHEGPDVTEHRQLKQLIRDRMARTGESYTTARRHVLARAAREAAPPLPAGLVKGYDLFGTEQHRHSAIAAHLLRQAGVVAPHTGAPLSEAMVSGLAGGIGFMYAGLRVPRRAADCHHRGPAPSRAVGRGGDETPWCRIHRRAQQCHPRAMAALDAALAQDQPVYASVGRPLLAWHRGDPALATEPYGVVVAGSTADNLLIDDGTAAPYSLPKEEFATAWAAYRKGRHHRLVLARPAPRRYRSPRQFVPRSPPPPHI